MIRVLTPAIATSIQDQGRVGYRMLGICRSGAMDRASLAAANRLAGAAWRSAGIELGPGPFSVEVTSHGTLAFAGAPRQGAPWWETIDVDPGDTFDLSGPLDGMWSYLAIGGGVDAPVVMGSRSTSVREGIGNWLQPGDVASAGGAVAAPSQVEQLPITGDIRVFGKLRGEWTVGDRVDRMGYLLESPKVEGGRADLWSEPLLPGCIQIPPSGSPIVLMAESPTVGGYTIGGVVHSQDLRLVSQTPPGGTLNFVEP